MSAKCCNFTYKLIIIPDVSTQLKHHIFPCFHPLRHHCLLLRLFFTNTFVITIPINIKLITKLSTAFHYFIFHPILLFFKTCRQSSPVSSCYAFYVMASVTRCCNLSNGVSPVVLSSKTNLLPSLQASSIEPNKSKNVRDFLIIYQLERPSLVPLIEIMLTSLLTRYTWITFLL